MKVIREVTHARGLDPWAGAKATWEKIVEEEKVDAFFDLMEEIYPDGIDEVDLNDMLWFERDWLYEVLGIE